MRRVTKVKKKILLLSALALCVTTVSLAMKRRIDNELDKKLTAKWYYSYPAENASVDGESNIGDNPSNSTADNDGDDFYITTENGELEELYNKLHAFYDTGPNESFGYLNKKNLKETLQLAKMGAFDSSLAKRNKIFEEEFKKMLQDTKNWDKMSVEEWEQSFADEAVDAEWDEESDEKGEKMEISVARFFGEDAYSSNDDSYDNGPPKKLKSIKNHTSSVKSAPLHSKRSKNGTNEQNNSTKRTKIRNAHIGLIRIDASITTIHC